jgi:hypothetical protein
MWGCEQSCWMKKKTLRGYTVCLTSCAATDTSWMLLSAVRRTSRAPARCRVVYGAAGACSCIKLHSMLARAQLHALACCGVFLGNSSLFTTAAASDARQLVIPKRASNQAFSQQRSLLSSSSNYQIKP